MSSWKVLACLLFYKLKHHHKFLKQKSLLLWYAFLFNLNFKDKNFKIKDSGDTLTFGLNIKYIHFFYDISRH